MQLIGLAARRATAVRSGTLRAVSSATRSYATGSPVSLKEEQDPQLGDYPTLPDISKQRRPARGWDDPQMRRNFGEPVRKLDDVASPGIYSLFRLMQLHFKEEMYSMWGPDAPVVPPAQALRHFTIVTIGFVMFGFLCKAIVPESPVARRQYPFSGLVTELGGLEENKVRSTRDYKDLDYFQLHLAGEITRRVRRGGLITPYNCTIVPLPNTNGISDTRDSSRLSTMCSLQP